MHDLSDPGQVGFAESEVALSGPHVIANHAVLGGRGETFRLGCDNILSGVQEAPVIPVTGCEKKQRNSEQLLSNAETTSPVIPQPAPWPERDSEAGRVEFKPLQLQVRHALGKSRRFPLWKPP